MLILKTTEPHDPDFCYITIRGGRKVLIDKADYAFLSRFKWFPLKSASSTYVVARHIRKQITHTIRLHRLLLNAPSWIKIHHINHNTFDNRRSNLQQLTEREHRHFDGWHIFTR